MDHYKLFINGEFVEAQDGAKFETIDPGMGLPIATVAQAGPADAEAAIMAARRAFDSGVWSDLEPAERAEKMMNFADHLNNQGVRLALTESMDSGGIIGRTKYEPITLSGMCRNLSHAAATEFPWYEDIPYTGNPFFPGRNYIRREPIGVCVGIIPWNFPMQMAVWKIAHAVTMGNSIVLKPASQTPLTALIVAEAAQAAGIPEGVINIITGPGGTLGQVLCTHPEVDKIAFTGSTEVGSAIMRMAADTVKKVTLELGGKSANIMLDDADIDFAVDNAIFGTFLHQGQICESGTRVLVQSGIYDEFLEKMKARAEAIRIGYQADFNSQMGPLVSAQQLATVESYVKLGREEGARVLTGGERAEVEGLDGYFYKPTIFVDVDNKMRIAQEEIFGPVVCVMKFDTDEEAIALANDSLYGLGGGVFTTDMNRAEKVAHGVKTGTMWVNEYHSFGDFCPFGGYKQSGVGREFGIGGLEEYTEVKRVSMSANGDREASLGLKMIFDYPNASSFSYQGSTKVNSGHGSLNSLINEVSRLGACRAMILTDPGVRDAGLADKARKALGSLCAGIFDDIAQDTDLETVDAAVDACRLAEADCIVSVGGGSVIDTAKVVAVTLALGGKANEHVAIQRLQEPVAPHIVVPTTSGTGSEVTTVAVIKSKNAGRKVFLVDPFIAPDVAILDPAFTMGLPKGLTATTAMDALTHAVEACTSIMANSICDGQALHAIRMITENLPKVIENPTDEKARSNMQVASTMAGWAFSVAQVGLAHAMAHTVGILYNVPHGAACGIMLPKVMRFNVDDATEKLAQVAQALGVNTFGMEPRDAALAAADAVEALMEKVGHPMRLRDVGVPEEGLLECAFHALGDAASIFNAKQTGDPEEVYNLYVQAY